MTPADPLRAVPPLPPSAGSDGGAFRGGLGQGPIHIDPTPPHIRAPLCARFPTVRDGPPRPLPPAPHNHLTFRFRVDSVVSFPVQYGLDGPGGGQGRRIFRCPSFTPPGGRDPRLHPPLPCAYDQLLRVCFREGLHQGGLPLSPTSCATSGVSSGGCGPRSPLPCPARVGPRAPPPSARVPPAFTQPPCPPCSALGDRPPWPSATLGPQQHWLSPSDVEDHALGAVHLPSPPGGALVLAAASRVGVTQPGR